MAAKKRSVASRRTNWPTSGRLEENVDAILKSRGLELNASVDKVLARSQRRRNPIAERTAGKKRLR